MSKQNGNKGRRFDRAFKEEAVRLLQTSGRRQRQIEPNDVADLVHEVRIARQLEGLGAVRLQPERALSSPGDRPGLSA